jgi:hypothetical protein
MAALNGRLDRPGEGDRRLPAGPGRGQGPAPRGPTLPAVDPAGYKRFIRGPGDRERGQRHRRVKDAK